MNLQEHFPVLVIILPLLAAPLCILINHRKMCWMIALGSCMISFFCSIWLFNHILGDGPISYALGGWQPPWGIEYRLDLLSGFMLLLLTAISSLMLLFSPESVKSEISKNRIVPFYALLLLTIAGLTGICVSGDVFNLFVFLEISSIASYTLICLGSDRRALNAAFKYLVMGTIGATFILIGIGFLYMQTGTLNMQDLAQRLPALYGNRTIRAGFAFLTVGIGLKLALFPLHLWLPNAYAYAPSVVSALLASTSTKVAVYILLRFLSSVFTLEFSLNIMPLDLILIASGAAALISASLVAVFQVNIKRLLAYSSVAQLGYIALAIGLSNLSGLTAAVLHLFNHALIKGTLFLALGALIYRIGSAELCHFRGALRQMPFTSAALIIGGLSLIGIPGTAGFVSKWYLVQACLDAGLWPLALLILLGSLLAVVYVWKMIEALRDKPGEQNSTEPSPSVATLAKNPVSEAPISMLIPIAVLVGANLYFGFQTELSAGIASQIASALNSGGAM